MADHKMYKTQKQLTRTLRLAYPAGRGRMVLRTELDWDKDLEPIEVSADGNISTFRLQTNQPFLYFKPCLVESGQHHWAVGPNRLVLMTEADKRIAYPYFFSPQHGRYTELIEFHSKILGRTHKVRCHAPAGYDENTLSTFPTIYMQDGQNIFFPEEAFLGQDWNVGGSEDTLGAMGAMEDAVVVGIYSGDRMYEYTKPGYELYGRSLAEEIVPEVERRGARVGKDRRQRGVWGSSLGGVVSFYCCWQHPDVFGHAACLSSTFSHKDDLMDRVLTEPPPDVGFYLDSGWPEDNYEVTLGMAMALVHRGWKYGQNLMHFVFPNATHNEGAWGARLHIPMQFFNSAVARASRVDKQVLGEAPFRQLVGAGR